MRYNHLSVLSLPPQGTSFTCRSSARLHQLPATTESWSGTNSSDFASSPPCSVHANLQYYWLAGRVKVFLQMHGSFNSSLQPRIHGLSSTLTSNIHHFKTIIINIDVDNRTNIIYSYNIKLNYTIEHHLHRCDSPSRCMLLLHPSPQWSSPGVGCHSPHPEIRHQVGSPITCLCPAFLLRTNRAVWPQCLGTIAVVV